MIKEYADDLPDVFLVVFGCCWGLVDVLGVLDGCTVGGDCVWMWLVLRFVGWRMIESCKCFVDVTGHGEVNFVGLVIPIDGEAKVVCAIPVRIAFIVLFEYCKEMFGICFVDVLDAEIVNNKSKTERLLFVLPESWGDCTLRVACFEELLG
jgi:hypothetical protein